MELLLDTLLGLWVAASIAAALFRSIRLATWRPVSLVAPATPAGQLVRRAARPWTRGRRFRHGAHLAMIPLGAVPLAGCGSASSRTASTRICGIVSSEATTESACGETPTVCTTSLQGLENLTNVAGSAVALEQAATRADGREQ